MALPPPEPAKKKRTRSHTLPSPGLGQVIGLVKAVEDSGGEADAAALSKELHLDLVRLEPVVSAAEFLGLLRVHEGDLEVTELGRRLLVATIRQRKAILREIMEQTPLFRQVTEMLRGAGRPLPRQEVVDALSAQLGSHQAEGVFKALVYWGRYTERLDYDGGSEILSLSVSP